MIIHPFEILGQIKAFFVGPPIEDGPFPTLIYFALSAEDSLQLDPFNQLVQCLEGLPLRIVSITLPGHENNLTPKKALAVWEELMTKGEPILPSFIDSVLEVLEHLLPHIQKNKLAVAGLSRGAYIACHVAAAYPDVSTILGFAPLTQLHAAKHFDLETLIPDLYNRTLRFYIGNHDTRVGTAHAFSFISKLAAKAYANRIRSAPIELVIGPSVGYQGHGTPPEVFQAGAEWIKGVLLHEL